MEIKLVKRQDTDGSFFFMLFRDGSAQKAFQDQEKAMEAYDKMVAIAKEPVPDQVIASTTIPDLPNPPTNT